MAQIRRTTGKRERGSGQGMSRELEVLREEYKRAVENPIFDDPKDYCILLDLIQNRIDEIEIRYANF
jgi:hypothetical protein